MLITRQVELINKGEYTEVIFKGEKYSKDLYAKEHDGKNWRPTANGNTHYFRSESGKEIAIEQINFKVIGTLKN